ncbi:alkaline phosphatase D family protein [Spongiactinospora sp. TRM90649]|uniref:alkaline phosphatase D family protein n=1 Tax=Spongiactinospora sp. TRM90649 TaxID=3031114 RepID=UPI0023F93AED|nr:alkaline phosphatase D family protein [Spongiactinospora sp. TRM90649]MDF5758271.1 alkaline phosphatase D family protein [Spongiactinospora sp. TRM90649]
MSAAAAGAGGLILPVATGAPAAARSRALARDPFTLGVASGDPAPDGFVLWTRLALDPLGGDGRGGMPSRDVEVRWQVAEDERFAKVVRSGTETASPRDAHSVHVEPVGLRPGREYFYRFRVDGHVSRTGRTRTAPAGESPLTFVVAACAHYEHGYYTAYRRLAEQDPDLVVHLGDYMYEYGPDGYKAIEGRVRRHTEGTCRTIADYRMRHAQYKSDADLQEAHAVAPWLVAFDDHEVENNWAGKVSSTADAGFARRKADAFRAYYENMPLRRTSVTGGASIRVHRRVEWGRAARFHLLDTRQFRDDQACADGLRSGCDERLAGGRTLLGDDQRAWLLDGLRRSPARWNLIGQQVLMAQRDWKPGPGKELSMDSWDGYAADRTRLLNGLLTSGAANPVVLTGDAHMHHAADLRPDFDDPDSPKAAVELVTSSVASDGDGYRDQARVDEIVAENPHISYLDQRRGYIVCRLSARELRADFRTLDYISRRGAPAKTSFSLTVPADDDRA